MWLTQSPLNLSRNKGRFNLPKHALAFPRSLLLCKIHDSEIQPKLAQAGLYVPLYVNSEQNSPNSLIWEQCVPLAVDNSEQNVLVLPYRERYVPSL